MRAAVWRYFALVAFFTLLWNVAPEFMAYWMGGMIKSTPLWLGVTILIVVPIHELGHAAAAALVGYRVLGIVIGTGPRLFSFPLRGVTIEIHAFPFGGAMIGLPRVGGGWVRLRHWLMVAGGPAANLILHLAWRGFDGGDHAHGGVLASALHLGVLSNLIALVTNLIPFRTSDGNFSDGHKLLTIPFWSRARLDELHAAAQVDEVLELAERGQLQDAEARLQELKATQVKPGLAGLCAGFVQHRARKQQAARAVWTKTLAEVTDSTLEAGIRNCIAHVNTLMGGKENTEAADRLSTAALRISPDLPAAIGTRGAVMVRLGLHADGLPLLRRGLKAARHRQDVAVYHAFLAIAEARMGRNQAACQHLAYARGTDPDCEVLTDAVEAIQHAASQAPDGKAPVGPLLLPDVDPQAVGHWRGMVRALLIATALLLPSAYPVLGLIPPVVLGLILLIYPERTTLMAFALSMLALAAISALGLGGLVSDGQRAFAATLGLLVGASAAWLARPHPATEACVTTNVARVAAVVLSVLSLLFMFIVMDAFGGMSPSRALQNLNTVVVMSPVLVGTATILFSSRRGWVSASGLLPGTLAVLLVMLACTA